MDKNFFKEPVVEVIYFSRNVIASSCNYNTCGCFDEEWCPVDFKDCTGDSASCECEINHNPAIGNCSPCRNFNQ